MNMLVKTLLLLLLPAFASGQNFNINVDSLKQALKTAPNDSISFNLSIKLGYYYLERDRDSALYFIEKRLAFAQRNNKTLDEANVLSLIGYEFMHLGKLPESYEYQSKALKMAEDPLNEGKMFGRDYQFGFNTQWTPHQMRLNLLAHIHHSFGLLMGRMEKTEQQIFHYKEAINIAETIGDTMALGFVNMNLGQVYWQRLGKLDSALLMEQNAEQMFIKTNQKSYLSFVYQIFAQVFLKQQKNGMAVQYFHKGIQSAEEQNNLAGLGFNYAALANFYINIEKNRDSSLYYSFKWLDVLKSTGSKDLGGAYKALSYSYELNNKPDSAFKYYKLAL